jgi:hypothetical protein
MPWELSQKSGTSERRVGVSAVLPGALLSRERLRIQVLARIESWVELKGVVVQRGDRKNACIVELQSSYTC